MKIQCGRIHDSRKGVIGCDVVVVSWSPTLRFSRTVSESHSVRIQRDTFRLTPRHPPTLFTLEQTPDGTLSVDLPVVPGSCSFPYDNRKGTFLFDEN